MKKISQINWKRYKESESGKEAIALFEKICSSECTMDEVYAIAKRFNPEFFKNTSNKEEQRLVEAFGYYDDFLTSSLFRANT